MIFLAFIAGAFYFLDSRFQFFRMRNVSLLPQNPQLENRVWRSLKARHIRFWPSLIADRKKISSEIERVLPVSVTLNLSTFGSLKVEARPLEVWSVIVWKGKEWFLEKNGIVWPADLEGNVLLGEMNRESLPLWEVGGSIENLLIEDGREHNELSPAIRRSNLPVSAMNDWLGRLEELSWYGLIKKIEINKRAAEYVLTLCIVGGSTRVFLTLKAEERNILEIEDAIKEIMPDFPFTEGDLEIDATFRKRIVIREDQ